MIRGDDALIRLSRPRGTDAMPAVAQASVHVDEAGVDAESAEAISVGS